VRAAILHGPGDLRIEEVPDPQPGPGDVLVQVELALTDSTDLKAYHRGHPLLLATLPSPFGHEFCGIDAATGRRVVAANSDGDLDDLHLLNGAYAELLVVPERIARVNLHGVPDGLEPEVAALLEPLACCLHGIERAELRGGERVAVLGAGPIGLMLCACIADAGAAPVVVGGRPERRALVPDFGGVTGDGANADVVIDAAGTAASWCRTLGLVQKRGTVILFSGLPRDERVAFDPYKLHYEEITLRGSFHHTPRTVRAALAFLASGAYPWEKLITHRIGLDELPRLFADPPRDLLKAAVVP
jgi:L-iditol 2-dehydrogenase